MKEIEGNKQCREIATERKGRRRGSRECFVLHTKEDNKIFNVYYLNRKRGKETKGGRERGKTERGRMSETRKREEGRRKRKRKEASKKGNRKGNRMEKEKEKERRKTNSSLIFRLRMVFKSNSKRFN